MTYYDEDKWDEFLADTYKEIVQAFLDASSKILVTGNTGDTARECLLSSIYDSNELTDLLEDVICSSQDPAMVDLRKVAGTMWAEKYCEKQALYEGKESQE